MPRRATCIASAPMTRVRGNGRSVGTTTHGSVLPATEAAVTTDEALERGDLLGARIHQAVDVDVRRLGAAGHAQHELGGQRTERQPADPCPRRARRRADASPRSPARVGPRPRRSRRRSRYRDAARGRRPDPGTGSRSAGASGAPSRPSRRSVRGSRSRTHGRSGRGRRPRQVPRSPGSLMRPGPRRTRRPDAWRPRRCASCAGPRLGRWRARRRAPGSVPIPRCRPPTTSLGPARAARRDRPESSPYRSRNVLPCAWP